MQSELSIAERELMAYRAYAGIAVHDYEGFRRIAASPK
jgi:hypothetical protein